MASSGDGRKSLAHLADKFNTAPPPGYVAGRGRGISGFSKPPPPEEGGKGKGRGRGRGEGGGRGGGGGGSSSADAGLDADDSVVVGDGKIEGDVANTDRLDLKDTERFEEAEVSMDSKEAGNVVEAFSMDAERKEGSFDEDFNFVWKKRGEDPDDVHDAFLDEVDAGEAESAEKLEKRRKLLERQIAAQDAPEEPRADKPTLLRTIAGLLQEKESVAAALRRLSGKGASGSGKGGGGGKGGGKGAQKQQQQVASGSKRPREQPGAAAGSGAAGGGDDDLEAVLRKQQFEQLTEAADALLRAGRFDIYSERREAILAEVDAGGGGSGGGSGGSASASGADGSDDPSAAEEQAASLGIDPQVHAGCVAGGFVLDASNRVYYNGTSGLFFDPRTTLYWNASAPGTYYYYDSGSGQFVPAEVPPA